MPPLRYRCSRCAYKTSYEQGLRHHVRRDHPTIVQCIGCGAEFDSRLEVIAHLLKRHGVFSCGGNCYYSTRYIQYLTRHKMFCGIKGTFTCNSNFCGFQTKNASEFNIHQASHAPVGSFAGIPGRNSVAYKSLDGASSYLFFVENSGPSNSGQLLAEPTFLSHKFLISSLPFEGSSDPSASLLFHEQSRRKICVRIQPSVLNEVPSEHSNMEIEASPSTALTCEQFKTFFEIIDEEQALSSPREDLNEVSDLMDSYPDIHPPLVTKIFDVSTRGNPVLGASTSANVERTLNQFLANQTTQICKVELEQSEPGEAKEKSGADVVSMLSEQL